MPTLVRKGRPLTGTVEVPGDKSLSHRAAMLASLSPGTVALGHLADGEDVRSTLRCLEALGVRIDREGDAVVVHGRGGTYDAPTEPLDCGNSGTTMRLLVGLLAGRGGRATLVGDESLSRRPMGRVLEPLRAMGADVKGKHTERGETAPIDVRPTARLRGADVVSEVASAQVKSAVLLAALGAEGITRYREPALSRDHTERGLRSLGLAVDVRDGELIVEGPRQLPALPLRIDVPGDPSSAAFFAVAAALSPGAQVELPGLSLNPTRTAFVDVMERMGAVLSRSRTHDVLGEPVGCLEVRGAAALTAVTVRARDVPRLIDELPVLAVLAAHARGTSRFEGVDELRHKESDRLNGVIEGLSALGGRARAEASPHGTDLLVEGGASLAGAPLRSHGDHRLAMAWAVAGTALDDGVRIDDAACCAISYPAFFDELAALGASVELGP